MKFGKTDNKIMTEVSELEQEYENEISYLTNGNSNEKLLLNFIFI